VPKLHLPSLFAELPWPIRWALILGGSLVTGFSARLPEAWQDARLYCGLASLAYGVVATGWHHVNLYRVKQGKTNLKLKSSHLIILGLVVALAVVAWQLRSARNQVAAGGIIAKTTATASQIEPVDLPQLNTQTAKENFQKAVDDLSAEIRQIANIEKLSQNIAGVRPLISLDQGGAKEPLDKLTAMAKKYFEKDAQLFAGGNGHFWDRYPLAFKQSLLTTMPRDTQRVWGDYGWAVSRLKDALQLAQYMSQHLEDRELYNASVRTAENNEDAMFRPALNALHNWLNVLIGE